MIILITGIKNEINYTVNKLKKINIKFLKILMQLK